MSHYIRSAIVCFIAVLCGRFLWAQNLSRDASGMPQAVRPTAQTESTTVASTCFDPVPLLQGMHRFDVTEAPFHARPDDGADDTMAIQAALNTAAEYSLRDGVTRQQIVYLPRGTYLVSDTLRFPKNRTSGSTRSRVECDQWLWGDGVGRTIIRLRAAADCGKVLGTAEQPKPVVQTAEYRLDNRAGGNVNFQLWVTDLSIVVPADQPHAVGLSYGSANMGAVRRVEIAAEGDGGHTGLGLVQFNNGPGFVEHVRVTGFDTGIEIHDNWGESFTFSDIAVQNQNPGGVGISITDKSIAMERVMICQDQPNVTPIRLFDDDTPNTYCGGAPHLTLLGAGMTCTAPGGATVPAVEIVKGHLYLRGITCDGYGEGILCDHGRTRTFPWGDIPGEFVSVHGRTIGEKPNVAVNVGNAPVRSLNLPVEAAPGLPPECWTTARPNAITVVSAADMEGGTLEVETPWVLVDPEATDDHTRLLQAALNSGARYVALKNTRQFVVSDTLVVNGPDSPRNVEVIYGLMTDVIVDKALAARLPPYREVNDRILFRFETGRHDQLYIKGLHLISNAWAASDFQLFQNNAGQTVVFEDIRAKIGPRHYRNGGASVSQAVFIENSEWAYNSAFPQPCNIFTGQNVWARNFNSEMNITPDPVMLPVANGRREAFSRFSTAPKITNDSGRLWSFGQKMGEYNGVFIETRNGGRTELLSVFLNEALDAEQFPPTPKAVCLVIKGDDSACSMVGQERPRGNGKIPHANTFARIETRAGTQIVKGTDLPTYLTYEGMDPFRDADPKRYFAENTFRVVGLFRCGQGIPPEVKHRDPYKWPFAQTSIWNMPIGSQAIYVHAGIEPAQARGMTIDEDIIVMTPEVPLMEIHRSSAGWSRSKSRCTIDGGYLFSAPIPQDFIVSPDTWDGLTPNSGLAVLMPDGRTIRQTQPFAHCEGSDKGTSRSQGSDQDIFGDGMYGAHGGSGLSAIGGALRVGELTPDSGPIRHVLKVNVYGKKNLYYDEKTKGYRWPARKADRYAKDNYGSLRTTPVVKECRMGALLALPAKMDLDSLGLETRPARILAEALQNYGAYIVDDTAWDVYALVTEWSPTGRFVDEFAKNWGFPMKEANKDTPWGRDMDRLFLNLHVVTNNGPDSIGGGGKPRMPLAPDLR